MSACRFIPRTVPQRCQKVTDLARTQATQVDLQGFRRLEFRRFKCSFPIPKNGLEAMWNHLLPVHWWALSVKDIRFLYDQMATLFRIGFRACRIYDQNMDVQTPNRLYSAMGSSSNHRV
ncbi:MAG: DUF1329 domain-containing protein [Rhodocyclaceae bacterium]|nr:DUF1329 domain-containing protein [Rhodocyclaceae bacterium]